VLAASLEKASTILYSQVGKALYSSLSLLASKELVLLKASSSSSLRVYITSLAKARHPAVSFFRRQEAIICRADFEGFYSFFSRAYSILLIVTDST
jgi:hypothetical protein